MTSADAALVISLLSLAISCGTLVWLRRQHRSRAAERIASVAETRRAMKAAERAVLGLDRSRP